MAITITHAKTNAIADWTQPELDAIIAGGAAPLPPVGTTLAEVTLPSDWNADHSISTAGANNGDVLTVVAGEAEWAAPSGGGSPAGSDTQVQFNDGGAFGADAGLVYNKTTDTLTSGRLALLSTTASTSTTTGALTVAGGVGIAGAGVVGQGLLLSSVNSGLRVEGAVFPTGTGAGFEAGYSTGGSTSFFQSYNRTTSAFAPLSISASAISMTQGVVSITNSTASTTSATGALVVTGGVGVGGAVNVAGSVTAPTFNGVVVKRTTTVADATSITPNCDTSDIVYQANTQALGTLTINAVTGTPFNGQAMLIKIKSTNVQTFSWNAAFAGGTVALPTVTTGGGDIDYFAFLYDSVNSKWHFTGQSLGF